MSEQYSSWYVHCAAEKQPGLEKFLSVCAQSSRCTFREDPLQLVNDAKEHFKARVLLGPGMQIDPVNLCGFLKGEAPGTTVLIIAEAMDEDFRKQAKQAGASWVLSAEDTIGFLELQDLADEHEEKESLQGRSTRTSVVSSALHTCEDEILQEKVQKILQEMQKGTPLEETRQTISQEIPQEASEVEPSPSCEEDDLDEPDDFEFDTNVLRLDRLKDFAQASHPSLQVPSIADESETLATSCIQSTAPPEVVNPLIVFASARGGVGKSTVGSVVALAMASLGKRVALLDLDLNFGNMFAFFGRGHAADLTPLSEAVSVPALQKCGERIHDCLDLYGPCEKPEYAELIVPRIPEICATLSTMYDIVLVDTSSSWGDATACAAQMAHKVCLMSDERTSAISSLARGANLLVRLGVPRTNVLRLINRTDPKGRDQDFFARKNPGLEQATTLSTFDGGLDVAEFLSAGDAPSLLTLENAFTTSCKSLSARLLKEVGCLPETRLAREYLEGKQIQGGTLLKFAQRAFLKEAS